MNAAPSLSETWELGAGNSLQAEKKQEVKIRAILVKALRVIQLTLMRINAPLNALLGRNRAFVP